MGMYDYIRCERPLPDGFTGELQTKDFDRQMVTHVISADGRLLMDNGHYEAVPKAERPYPNEPDDSVRGIYGSIRRVPKMEDANFHGVVNFYGIDESGGGHIYNAKFTDGQLVGIDLVPEPGAAPASDPQSQ